MTFETLSAEAARRASRALRRTARGSAAGARCPRLRRLPGDHLPAGRDACGSARISARSCSTAASCSAGAWRSTSSRSAGPRARSPTTRSCSTWARGSPARASRRISASRASACTTPSRAPRPGGRRASRRSSSSSWALPTSACARANQEYGLSARGLAIGTGAPEGEEFPDFVAHWICEPEPEARALTCALAPRQPERGRRLPVRDRARRSGPDRRHRGAPPAPGRSRSSGWRRSPALFLFGQNGPGARGAKPFDDFRPQVHDSDGLCVAAGADPARLDRIWRPLVNGRAQPQISAFAARPLAGFGLLQRERSFAAYLDVEARHEARPGLWVAPDPAGGAFADGAVQLFEIPSGEEVHGQHRGGLRAGRPGTARRAAARRLRPDHGGRRAGAGDPGGRPRPGDVDAARLGGAPAPVEPAEPRRRLCVIDFEGPGLPRGPDDAVAAEVSASAGTMHEPVANFVPQTGGWRIYVEWRPPEPVPPGDVVLRARLVRGTVPSARPGTRPSRYGDRAAAAPDGSGPFRRSGAPAPGAGPGGWRRRPRSGGGGPRRPAGPAARHGRPR